MKQQNLSIYLFIILLITFLSSCEEKEEYKASITVINDSALEVDTLTLKGSDINWVKTIEVLPSNTEQTFEVKWTGKSSALFGSMENVYIGILTGYSINGTKYDLKNLVNASKDENGVFYTEENITNGSKVTISIHQNSYEVIVQ